MSTHRNPLLSRFLPCAAVVRFALSASPLIAQEEAAPTLAAEVDALFSSFDTPESPGCVLGIMQGGKFLYQRGYGMASLEDSIPLSPNTTMYIASVVKQFVAASVLLAADQGYLSLDDDIRTYLPEVPEYESPITIRHLIHHTSGLRDIYTLMWLPSMEWAGAPDEQEALSILGRQEDLNFTPGAAWAYTTSNYELLGHIVARATGTSLWAFAEAELFGPLGMTNTQMHHGAPVGATGYRRAEGGGFQPAEVDDRRGAYTTLEDFLTWDRNLYGSAVGGVDFARRLATPGTLANGEEHRYAFGLAIGEYRGLRTVAHGGAFRGFRAAYLRFPDQAFSVVCFCNTEVWAVRLASRVADIYLKDQFHVDQPGGADLTDEDLASFTGTYVNSAGQLLTLQVTETGLAFVGSRRTNPLVALSRRRFRSPSFGNNEYQFYRAAPDSSWHFKVTPAIAGIMPSRGFVFRAVEPASPTRADLERFVGEYQSHEVPATYMIVLESGKLLLERGRDLSALPLRLTVEDTFSLEGKDVTIEFSRDKTGGVTGFRLDAPGVWNLRFTRAE